MQGALPARQNTKCSRKIDEIEKNDEIDEIFIKSMKSYEQNTE